MIAKLKTYLTGFWFSLPVQLFLLHFKRYQVLLVFWYILFATVNGTFLQRFGAQMLFLYPEYLDEVNAFSTLLVGSGYGVFVMCWNITTFILFSRHFRFLAATTQPFLKYCINNAVLPIIFLVFYLVKAIRFTHYQELLTTSKIVALTGGFLAGFATIITLSIIYFFGADRTIYRRMPVHHQRSLANKRNRPGATIRPSRIRIDWYITATFRLRQPRDVSHYDTGFLERIFGQHHLAAIFSVLFIFVCLITAGYFQDSIFLQLPSAGSIMVFFAILISVAGGFAYFLRAWSVPAAILGLMGLNYLYKENILDPRNKAYGVHYESATQPVYNAEEISNAALPRIMAADSLQYIHLLNKWKNKQPAKKPVLTLIAVSGGGSRAATFSVNVLRTIDSSTQCQLLPATFMISGASGGIIGAAWYRELFLRRQLGIISNHFDRKYTDAITHDLLNPVFSSIVTRDLLAPAQYFEFNGKRYIRDRGYAFEQRLNRNTFGWLNKPIQAYAQYEANGTIPLLLTTAVITRDGRKLWFANQPARFLCRPGFKNEDGKRPFPDGIDFMSFFASQDAADIRFLSVLRMNATFPYILPNVWLPTNPIIDVMDAGFRDNTGLETATRFIHYFQGWIKSNCSKVVLLQVRDKPEGGWNSPYESDNIFDMITKPALLTQNNLFRFQEYDQLKHWDMLQNVLGPMVKRVVFEYQPGKGQEGASLSFHLTRREKEDIEQSMLLPHNQQSLQIFCRLLQPYKTMAPKGE